MGQDSGSKSQACLYLDLDPKIQLWQLLTRHLGKCPTTFNLIDKFDGQIRFFYSLIQNQYRNILK